MLHLFYVGVGLVTFRRDHRVRVLRGKFRSSRAGGFDRSLKTFAQWGALLCIFAFGYSYGVQIKAYEVGGTNITHKRDEFWAENRKERYHFGSLGVCEIMMITCFLNNYDGRVFTGFAWAGVGFSSVIVWHGSIEGVRKRGVPYISQAVSRRPLTAVTPDLIPGQVKLYLW
jgi:hypothetical protein